MSTRGGCVASNAAIASLAEQRAREIVETVHERLLDVRIELERDPQPIRMADLELLQVDGQLVAGARPPRGAARASATGSTIGASPVLTAFVRKMSPNDGASTTRNP